MLGCRMLRFGFALLLSALVIGCSEDDPIAPTSTSTGAAGAGGSGGTGGAGGAAKDEICVESPQAAPFAGTDDCPAPVPDQADTFDAALAAGDLDRCGVRLLPEDVSL